VNGVGRALAIEVTAAAVRVLRLGGVGRWRRVGEYAERVLPAGLVVPSATAPNVQDEAAFAKLLNEVVGSRPPRRVRLVLPDCVARLHILDLDGAPPNGPELPGFLLWCLRDTLPFPGREARVAYTVAPDGRPGRRVALTVVGREPVLGQYERLLKASGIRVAHLAPAAWHLFTLAAGIAPRAPAAVRALLTLDGAAATLILAEAGVPRYVRTFRLPPGASASAADPPPAPAEANAAPREHPPWLKELGHELLRSFDHALETSNVPPPADLLLAGAPADAPALSATLQAILEIPCILLALPAFHARSGGPMPPQAAAVCAAALARVG
jgi:hypothetical protein